MPITTGPKYKTLSLKKKNALWGLKSLKWPESLEESAYIHTVNCSLLAHANLTTLGLYTVTKKQFSSGVWRSPRIANDLQATEIRSLGENACLDSLVLLPSPSQTPASPCSVPASPGIF